LNGKINHEDSIFLDDADQKDDADQRDNVQVRLDELNREKRADAGRRKRGKNGDGMNETLIEDAENDVNGRQER